MKFIPVKDWETLGRGLLVSSLLSAISGFETY
jgi:hypothetical protein